MIARPLTLRCASQLESRKHVCFGVSPFNSYFTETKLLELARFGRSEFDSMHFFIPDVPTVYTLQAMGYSAERAETKARQQSNYTRNKIMKALSGAGATLPESWKMITGWKDLMESKLYSELHTGVQACFDTNSDFRSECIEASRWVLEKKIPDEEMTEERLQCAVKYLLAEIPLFMDSAGIHEQSSSVFCYHQSIPFLDRLYQGLLPISVSSRQGFVVASSSNEVGWLPADGLTQASFEKNVRAEI